MKETIIREINLMNNDKIQIKSISESGSITVTFNKAGKNDESFVLNLTHTSNLINALTKAKKESNVEGCGAGGYRD